MKNADTGTFDTIFRQKAPKRDLKLLGTGERVTLVEICVFLPNWLKHGDVSKQFWFGGLNRNHIVNIMNWHCSLERAEGVTPNLITNWMNVSMRKLTGNKRWTHKSYAAGLDRSDWDPTNLTLAGCKLNKEHVQRKKGRGSISVIDRVPFGSLGDHVQHMPQGVDGLDLTRFVQYARDHPQEELWFPQDFGFLAQKLGTVRVEQGHLGVEIAKRWKAPIAKDQKSQAQQLVNHSGALRTSFVGESVAEGSRTFQGEPYGQNTPVPATYRSYDAANIPYDAIHTSHDTTHMPYDATYMPYNATHTPYDAAHTHYDAAHTPYDAAHTPYDAAHTPYDAVHTSYDTAYTTQDDVDTHFPVLVPMASASQQPVPENSQASYWDDFSAEDYTLEMEDDLSLLLHQDVLNTSVGYKQDAEPEYAGDSLAAAGVLSLGPCLDDDDIDVLYNRCQDMLYMAVTEHVDPMLFDKEW